MKNFQNYIDECIEMCKKANIELGHIEQFVINSRAKARWGYCRLIATNSYIIEISNELLRDDTSEEGLKKVILHELLHTCKGCLNHGQKWQTLASKINLRYGYNITRTDSSVSLGGVGRKSKRIERNQV